MLSDSLHALQVSSALA